MPGKYFNIGSYNPSLEFTKYFNVPEVDISMEGRIRREEAALKRMGVTPPPEVTRSALDRIFDALSIGQYAVLGGLKNSTDNDANTTIGQGVIGGIKAGNPFGQGYEQGEANTKEVLENLGWKNDDSQKWYQGGNLARNITGFVGDVLLDPTTYFSGGTSAFLKGTGKSAIKSAGQQAMEEGIEKSMKELADGEGAEILLKLGQDESKENVDALLRKIQRQANVKPTKTDDLKWGIGKAKITLAKDETLRKIGDATIAPYFNKASDAIKSTETIQKLDKYFNSKKNILQKEAAQNNTKELFKIHAFEQYAVDMNNTFKTTQQAFAEKSRDMFSDLDEDTQKLMTDILERKEFWTNVEETKDIKIVSRMTEQAQQFMNNLVKIRDGWQELVNKYSTIDGYETKLSNAQDMLGRIDNILNSSGKNYEDIVKAMSNNAEPIKSIPKERLYTYLNEFVDDDINTIMNKLIETEHFAKEDAFNMAHEIRTALDKARGNVEEASQILWRGQELGDEITQVEGQPFTSVGQNEFLFNSSIKALSNGWSDKKVLASLRLRIDDDKAQQILDAAKKRIVEGNEKMSTLSDEAFTRRAETDKAIKDAYMENSYYNRNKHEQQVEDNMFDMAEKRQIKNIQNQNKYFNEAALTSADNELFDDYVKKGFENKNIDEVEGLRNVNKTNDAEKFFDNLFEMEKKIETQGGDVGFLQRYIEQQLKKNGYDLIDYLRYTKALYNVNTIPNSIDPIRKDVLRNILDGKIDVDEADLYLNPVKKNQEDFSVNAKEVKANADKEVEYWLNRINGALKNDISEDEILRAVATKVGRDKAQRYIDLAKKGIEAERTGGWEKLFAKSGQKTEQINKYFDAIKNGSNPVKSSSDEIATTVSKVKPPRSKKEYATTANKEVRDIFDYNGTKVTAPISNAQDIKMSMVKKGIDHITALNPKFGALLNDVTTRLLDLDATAEATIKHSTKEIMLPNNKKFSGEALENRIKNRLFPHEVGHALQRELGIKNEQWENVIAKDANKIPDGGEGASGDFTETLSLLMRNPQKLAEEYPERFMTMQGIIKNYKPDMSTYKAAKMDTELRVRPKSAKQDVTEKIETIVKKRNELADEVVKGGVSKEDAVNELEQAEKNIETEHFEDLYRREYSDDTIYEYTYDTTKEIHRVLDEAETSKISLSEKAKQVLQIVKDEFKLMGTTENIDEMMEDYVTHMIRITDAGKGSSKLKKYFNPYNLQRKHRGTIKELNEILKKKYGVDDAFESILGKIYMERGLKHNQLVFEKQFYEKLVDMFGERIIKLEDKAVDKKLFASTSDVIAMVDKVSPMSIEDAMKGVNLPKHKKEQFIKMVNEYGTDQIDSITEEMNLDEKIQDELLKALNNYDQTRKTEFLKNHKLPMSLLDATQIGKSKFAMRPIVEIDANTFSAFKKMNDKFEGFTMSDVATEMVNRMGKIQIDDLRPTAVKIYDKFLRLWKLNQTSVNPGFHLRNFYSNQFNNYLAGGSETINPQTQIEATSILKNAEGSIKTNNGKVYTYNNIRSMFAKNGLMNEGAFTKDLFDENTNPLQALTDLVQGKNKVSLNPLDDKNFIGYKYGREVGSFIENQARMSNFIAQLKLGKDQYEAAELVNKFLFDYSDLSEFEKNVMKRLVPFYTWMRKNIPLQMEQLLVQPNTYRNVGKAMNAIRDLTPEDEKVEKKDINEFARDWVQLPINTKGTSGNKEPVFWNPNMPFQDFNRMSARDTIGSLTPAIKLPIELATNHNWYFNSPISRGIGDTDNAPGYVQALLGQEDDPNTKKNEAAQMNPYLRHVLRNLASAENVSKMIETKDSDKLISALNALLGVKTYSYDVENYREWALRDRLKQLQDLKKHSKR